MDFLKILFSSLFLLILFSCLTINYAQIVLPEINFESENENELANKINKSFRIAVGDITGNIKHFKGGMLKEEKPCIVAGLDYDKPWTRDASINVWNCGALISPEIAKNTLLAQTDIVDGKQIIIGQEWDNIIWSLGAWHLYLATSDNDFLAIAYDVIKNTILIREAEEFNTKLGLFRGPAVYGDGIAAYPDYYAQSSIEGKSGTYSGISSWAKNNPEKKFPTGFGVPMYVLSTNCVYYQAYRILYQMSEALNSKDYKWMKKANNIKDAINNNLWNEEKGTYNYFIDYKGTCYNQEGMGEAFAILFGIADEEKAQLVFNNIQLAKSGIPCVYPTFNRYTKCGDEHYGRHSGTVWPHIQGFWADACLKNNQDSLFLHEFVNLTNNSFRDNQFVEIYHPVTGESYGGLQEADLEHCHLWDSCNRQTWSATAYVRMILSGILGMDYTLEGLSFKPNIPFESDSLTVRNVNYRDANLLIKIAGSGYKLVSCKINGEKKQTPFIPNNAVGNQVIEIELEK